MSLHELIRSTTIRKLLVDSLRERRTIDVQEALALRDQTAAIQNYQEHQREAIALRSMIERTIRADQRSVEIKQLHEALDSFIGEIALTLGAIRREYRILQNGAGSYGDHGWKKKNQ